MKKRILIDATTVSEKLDGLSQFIISLLENFPAGAFELFDFTILINPGKKPAGLERLINAGNFNIIEARINAIGPRRDIQMFFFWKKHRKYFDIFHSTSNQYPLCIKNGIATIHDITFRKHFNESWRTFKLAKAYVNFITAQSLKRAGSVIAVSLSTKQMLKEAYPSTFNEEKFKIIYEGWEHLIPYGKTDNSEYTHYGHYLFYAGSSRKHKNLKKLLEAFCLSLKYLPPDLNLVLSGQKTHLDKEDLAVLNLINSERQRALFTGYVSEDELNFLFKNASAFIFPSLSEGFGLPVLESFYFEKPLLSSNATSLPEIAGDAALYFNPESVEDISRAIVYFYDHPEVIHSMVQKGKARLQLFSWGKTAIETIELYKSHLLRYP